MSQASHSTELAPAIRSRLAQLRWSIRGYYWLQGVAMIVVGLAAIFWITLLIDWLFEPTYAVRLGILIASLVCLGLVAFRYIISRMLVPLSDRNMAVLLERRNRKLSDRLLTAVELRTRPADKYGFDAQMLAHTRDEAAHLAPRQTSAASSTPDPWPAPCCLLA